MEEHIFVTPTGLCFKPSCDSPDPDFSDFHFVTLDLNASVLDVIRELMELNDHVFVKSTEQNLPFSLHSDSYQRFKWPKGTKQTTMVAS
jgi:hypothetical protein